MAELFDIVLRRQIYIEGLKNSKGREFAVALANLRYQLGQRLAQFEYAELGDATKGAILKLIRDLREIARKVFDPYLTALIDWLARFVGIDFDVLRKVFGQAVPDAKPKLDDQDKHRAIALAFAAPMAATGTLAVPFVLALLPTLYVTLERTTMQNFASRVTRAELIAAIVGNEAEPAAILRRLKASGDAATNTVIQHLSNQTNDRLGSKLLGFYEWVSVLDNRTTAICISRDGNRYEYGKGPLPPAHPNCRSTTVPIAADAVPTPKDFTDWLSGQPDAFVSDALDGRPSSSYEGSKPIGLTEYIGKTTLIGL